MSTQVSTIAVTTCATTKVPIPRPSQRCTAVTVARVDGEPEREPDSATPSARTAVSSTRLTTPVAREVTQSSSLVVMPTAPPLAAGARRRTSRGS